MFENITIESKSGPYEVKFISDTSKILDNFKLNSQDVLANFYESKKQ